MSQVVAVKSLHLTVYRAAFSLSSFTILMLSVPGMKEAKGFSDHLMDRRLEYFQKWQIFVICFPVGYFYNPGFADVPYSCEHNQLFL